MNIKRFLQKTLPKSIYSFIIRLGKVSLTIYATSGIRNKNKNPVNSKKKILIVKSDAIGDYIMFRNFIQILKKSKKYRKYGIYLLGNESWRNIFEKLDKFEIDKSEFINRRYLYNKKYITEKLEKLNKEDFEIIIHPVCHRDFIIDYIIKKTNAKEKIGYAGKSMNQRGIEKKFTDKFYTKLIKTKEKLEFNRNKDFFEQIIGEKINLQNPKINIKKKTI
ncbi:MAG: hypothetical protein V1888_00175 [archaeon]